MKGVFKSFAPETQELQVNFSLEYKKPRWKAKSRKCTVRLETPKASK